MREHRYYAKKSTITPEHKGCTAFYAAINKYGFTEMRGEVLITCADKDLKDYETKMIVEHKTLAPNGYNLTSGGEQPTVADEVKAKMPDAIREGVKRNIESFRTHKEDLEGLPMYVCRVGKDEPGKLRGYSIKGHPKCKFKRFVSRTKPLLSLKANVIEFLKTLENSVHESHHTIKHNRGIPKGISTSVKHPGGYQVAFEFRKKTYTKYFGRNAPVDNLTDALIWMTLEKVSLELHEEQSSTTKCQSALKELKI